MFFLSGLQDTGAFYLFIIPLKIIRIIIIITFSFLLLSLLIKKLQKTQNQAV